MLDPVQNMPIGAYNRTFGGKNPHICDKKSAVEDFQ